MCMTWLSIFNGIVVTDLLIILLTIFGFFQGKMLKNYYRTYGVSGVLLDVLIIAIGFVIARAIYPLIFKEWSLWKFIVLLVVIQVVHDYLFYLFIKSFASPRYPLLQMFHDYAKEVSYGAILGDSFMMVMSALLAYALAKQPESVNVAILIVSSYLALFAALNV